MKILRKTLLALAVAAIGTTATVSQASVLRISDGVNPVVEVVDGGAGDLSPSAGAVTFVGAIGVWDINVDTGFSYPALGSPTEPHMDISFGDISNAAGTLTLMFSEVGFSSALGNNSVVSDVGGTITASGGTVTYKTYYSDTNSLFAMENELTSQSFNTPSFSGSAVGSFYYGGEYSLTQWVQISHRGLGATSGDASVMVPEPFTLGLMGLGLFGIGLARRRRTV